MKQKHAVSAIHPLADGITARPKSRARLPYRDWASSGDLRTLAESYARSVRAENKSPRTVTAYLESLRLFSGFLAAHQMPLLVAKIRREHVESYIGGILETQKASTAHHRYRALHGFFKWCVIEGEAGASPMAHTKPPAIPEEFPPVISEDSLHIPTHSSPHQPEPSMPITPDPATRHDALNRKPDPSGVSVRVTGHTTRPSVALTLARAASGVPAYVTADQVAAMVACATTTRDRLLLRTLWESGGRVSEVASLRLCDIDRTEGALQLTNLKQRGPRRHVKLVYISRDLAGALLALARDTRLGHDGHLFRSRQSGEGHLTRQQVLRIVNRLAVDAGGIVQGRTGPRPACGLDFRHGSAVHLLRSGVPLTEVQSHLGHARVDTTTVYLRLTNRDRRSIADRIGW